MSAGYAERSSSTARAGEPPLLEVHGSIATLTLRRPARANRIEPDDLVVLVRHCEALAESHAQVRAVIFTGTGDHFSAGYDISSIVHTVRAGLDDTVANPFATMVDTVEALPQVTVCALNGGVFGGATDLALACDYRLGIPSTRMFMPAALFGLHYYSSGMRRYVTRLGLGPAKRLFLFAEEFNAQEMLSFGYLDEIVPSESLQARAADIANRAASLGPLAVAGMKSTLNALAAGSADAESIAAAELRCLHSDDLREGLTAWREKRQPHFHGR